VGNFFELFQNWLNIDFDCLPPRVIVPSTSLLLLTGTLSDRDRQLLEVCQRERKQSCEFTPRRGWQEKKIKLKELGPSDSVYWVCQSFPFWKCSIDTIRLCLLWCAWEAEWTSGIQIGGWSGCAVVQGFLFFPELQHATRVTFIGIYICWCDFFQVSMFIQIRKCAHIHTHELHAHTCMCTPCLSLSHTFKLCVTVRSKYKQQLRGDADMVGTKLEKRDLTYSWVVHRFWDLTYSWAVHRFWDLTYSWAVHRFYGNQFSNLILRLFMNGMCRQMVCLVIFNQ